MRTWSVIFDEEEGGNVIYEAETLKSLLIQISEEDHLDLADTYALSIRDMEALSDE